MARPAGRVHKWRSYPNTGRASGTQFSHRQCHPAELGSPVTGADHYLVFVQVVGTDPDFVEEATTFTNPSATIGPYNPGETVRVKVRAVADEQSSPDSETAELTLSS